MDHPEVPSNVTPERAGINPESAHPKLLFAFEAVGSASFAVKADPSLQPGQLAAVAHYLNWLAEQQYALMAQAHAQEQQQAAAVLQHLQKNNGR